MRAKNYCDKKEAFCLSPKKSLGQNFLQSRVVLEKIIRAGEVSERDTVVEIGPGRGFLTKALLETAGRVMAIEKDEKLVAFLEEQAWFKEKQSKITLVAKDVLEFDLLQFFQKKELKKYKLIANIPYYITGKILRFFQELELRPELVVLLVQKEVAERICAPGGEKSLLSVASEYFGKCQIVDFVGKENFFPVPEVDSAILKIIFKDAESLPHRNPEDRKAFFRLVKMGFASRRKTLLNNLKISWEKERLEQVFPLVRLDLKVRAQELELKDWLALEKFFVN